MNGCQPLDPSEVRLVLKSFGGKYANRDRALFALGCATGYRIAELLSLRLGDVWREDEVVRTVSVRRSSMKGKKAGRSVRLADPVRAIVGEWIEELTAQPEAGKEIYLFKSRQGTNRPITAVQATRVLQDAFEANRPDLRGGGGRLATHTMRKTFAKGLYEDTGDIYRVKEALGHASVRTTQAYLAVHQDDIDEAVAEHQERLFGKNASRA